MSETLTRDAVVAATRELISAGGLDTVSLRRVGAALGVTAPALYAYVADKRDLLRAVADGEFRTLIERFRAVDDPDPLVRTRRYCRAYIDHALDRPELFKVMFLFQPQLGVGDEPGADLASATEAFELPAAALVEAIEQGRVGAADPLVATFTMWAAVHGTAEVLLMGFDLGDDFTERFIDSTVDAVIRGLGDPQA
jgi:AcrR family transcriptional regulator